MPDIYKLAKKERIINYQSVFKGNDKLTNELYHNIKSNYFKINMHNGNIFVFQTQYLKKIKGIVDIVNFVNYNQLQSNEILNNSYTKFLTQIYLSKRIGYFNFDVNGNYTTTVFKQKVNRNIINNKINKYLYDFSIKCLFDKLPIINIGFNQEFNFYNSNDLKSKFKLSKSYFELTYDFLKNFELTCDYSRYSNSDSTYDTSKIALFYHKENSPWSFSFLVENLFNSEFKQFNKYTKYVIEDTKMYLRPRLIMFTMAYKL